jgi:hypothetical protein
LPVEYAATPEEGRPDSLTLRRTSGFAGKKRLPNIRMTLVSIPDLENPAGSKV